MSSSGLRIFITSNALQKFNTVLFCFVFLQEAKTPAVIESPLEIFPTAVKKIEEDDIW
jgi:hypothetical protein